MNLLSIDLNTARLSNQGYLNLLNNLNCSQIEIHIYNYIETKHSKLPFCHGEILHKYLGSRKKVALDIKQALDIVELCTNNEYKEVYVLCGEYESEFLFNKLNEMQIIYHKISQTSCRQSEITTNDSEILERIENNTPKKSNIIPFDVDDNKAQSISIEKKANLSPEQIKKIYNYIKYKQMESKLRSM